MVVGNKIDLKYREVTTEEGQDFARKHHTLYVESSAKTADGIKCCFDELVRKVCQLICFSVIIRDLICL
jgi:Ras-related protein Rab-18